MQYIYNFSTHNNAFIYNYSSTSRYTVKISFKSSVYNIFNIIKRVNNVEYKDLKIINIDSRKIVKRQNNFTKQMDVIREVHINLINRFRSGNWQYNASYVKSRLISHIFLHLE